MLSLAAAALASVVSLHPMGPVPPDHRVVTLRLSDTGEFQSYMFHENDFPMVLDKLSKTCPYHDDLWVRLMEGNGERYIHCDYGVLASFWDGF